LKDKFCVTFEGSYEGSDSEYTTAINETEFISHYYPLLMVISECIHYICFTTTEPTLGTAVK